MNQSQTAQRIPQDGFPRLHWDTLLAVVCLLDVRSIVNLMMTCKSLQTQLRQSRYVWRCACYFLADEEFLAPHSLLLDSMTTDDLYQCATRPLRLRAAIINDNIPPLYPRRLIFRYPREIGWRWHNRSSHLLPGGRWLLDSASDYEYVHLFCWDLLLGPPEAPRQPVATIKASLPGDENIQFQAQYSPIHGRAAVLLSVDDLRDEDLHHKEVFHLIWTTGDQAPRFVSVARLTCEDADGDGMELCDDVVSWYNNTCVTLWNWQSDTWAKIGYAGYFSESISHAWVQSQGVFLLTYRADSVMVLGFPPMEPTAQPVSVHPVSGVEWSLPTVIHSLRYSSHITLGGWKPTQHRIYNVRVHGTRGTPEPDSCFFVDTQGVLDGIPPRIIHPLVFFPIHPRSHAHHLASDLLITIGSLPHHQPDGATFHMRAYPSSGSTPLPAPATLRTDIALNRWHKAYLSANPCAVSGTFLVNEWHREKHAMEWLPSVTLFTFN